MNKKAETESGALQNLITVLLLVSVSAVLLLGYLNSLGQNYDVPVNETEYAMFNQFDAVNQTVGEFSSVFNNEEGDQSTATDIITLMLTGGYSFIKLIFNIPEIFSSIINGAVTALGLPLIVGGMIKLLIISIILFSALALVMKVRA